MSVHVCKQCGLRFEYCRSCVFKPIYYKDLGFCSKTCLTESKKEVIPTEDVEVVVIEEDTSTPKEDAIECPQFFTATEEEVIDTKEENEINDYEQNYGEDV